MKLRLAAMILLVVLAGCGGQSPAPTETAEPTPSVTETVRSTPTETATATPTTTATPRPTATSTPRPPDNPWGKSPVTVAVSAGGIDESVRPSLAEALSFWESNLDETEYSELTFQIINDTDEADVVVEVTEELSMCGDRLEPQNVGCAPYPGPDGFDGQATVNMEAGYTAESRVAILKHEFGHTLGLTHDAPVDIMNPELSLTNLPQTDAVDKENPWEKDTIYIHVNDSAVPEPIRDDHGRHVDHAISYYQDGAEGFTPENVSIERTDSSEGADITVTFRDRSDIGDRDEWSSATVYGTDSDDDGRLEVFTDTEIELAYNVEGDYGVTSYNLGYWIAYSFAAQEGEYPPPWEQDTITYEDHWWQRA